MQRAKLLRAILLIGMLLSIILGVVLFLESGDILPAAGVGIVVLGLNGFAFYILERGFFRVASLIFFGGMWVAVHGGLFSSAGLDLLSLNAQVPLLIAAGLLLGGRASITVALLSILANFAAAWTQRSGLPIASSFEVSDTLFWLGQSVYLVMAAVLLYLASERINDLLKSSHLKLLQLHSAHEQLATTLNALPDLMFEVDRFGRVHDFRAPNADDLYQSPEEFLYRRLHDFMPRKAADTIVDAIEEAEKLGWSRGGTYSLDSSAGPRWYELSVTARSGARSPEGHFIALVRDVTERVTLEQRLKGSLAETEELARTDDLTGLLNRRALVEMAEAEINRSQRKNSPVSFMLIDMYLLKTLNDDYGHLVGDEALRQVANILKGSSRPYDWVGRWGGDEFLLVLPETTLESASGAAERIIKVVEETKFVLPNGGAADLQISVGVSGTIGNGSERVELDSLLDQADQAMYLAKGSGPNQVGVF